MQHVVSSAYIALLLRTQWLPVDLLCQGTPFDEHNVSHLEYLNAEDVAQLFSNLDHHLNRPTWPVELGNRFGLTTHGPLGFAALTAPTLGSALKAFVDFHAVRVTALSLQLEVKHDRALLTITDTLNHGPIAARMVQLVVRIIESLIETILGHNIGDNVLITFAGTAPVHAEALCEAYHGRVLFDSPVNAISLPSAWLALPSPLYDEHNYLLHCRQCRDIINRLLDPKDIIGKVHRLLDNHFDEAKQNVSEVPPPPSLEDMAKQLHVSPRTLIRHLRQHDYHYRTLIEEKRQATAEQLLLRPGYTVSDIAYRLGYREVANFVRAFKTWYGCTPNAWRQKQ
ncbi:MAG TPA: AraC family transcriptional regulator ligand-binding domain-containing protein [Pseudomonadales bacterium]|nr:AraC family transcriptional regulator ligand-binding domain-containing protein [Pseudomonadales bacterium]